MLMGAPLAAPLVAAALVAAGALLEADELDVELLELHPARARAIAAIAEAEQTHLRRIAAVAPIVPSFSPTCSSFEVKVTSRSARSANWWLVGH